MILFLVLIAEGDEYAVFRQNAKEHWNSMRSYYQKVRLTIFLVGG